MPSSKQVVLGGIIKHQRGGYGFKVTFPDSETANKYKDMLHWILKDDGHPLVYNTGYHDKYNIDGEERSL